MKKFTHALPVLLSILTFHGTTVHASEQMRDMSLSVEETNHQLATPQHPRSNVADPGFYNDSDRNGNFDYNDNNSYNNGYNNNYNFDTPISPNMADTVGMAGIPGQANNQLQNNNVIGRRLPPSNRGMNRGFINKFCSSDYAPRNASSDAQKSCMDTQRQEACDRFQHAAVNIQRILSQAIDCEANSSGYNNSECDGLDASRLDMLKQYWQDEDTSYTILYLPDMVVNSASNCSPNNRHATN